MEVLLRRLRADDISQVVDIEREAFSPLWTSTPFKRELNNRYASYLVACCSGAEEELRNLQATSGTVRGDSWRRLLGKIPGLARKRPPSDEVPDPLVAGYVSVWYQGEEAHITEIAVREKLRGRGIGERLLIGSLRAADLDDFGVVVLQNNGAVA